MKSSFSVGLNCSRKLHAGVFCKGEKAMNEAGLKKAKMKSLAFSSVGFYAPCAFNFTCFGAALQLLQQKLF